MELIRGIMAHDRCEVFTYLNYNFLQRFLDDTAKDAGRDAAFGTPAWRDAVNRPEHQQYQTLMDRYRAALHDIAGAKYVWQFAMSDRHEKPLYWLFFATNHIKGLEVMKRAMWGVDPLGTFSFTDADAERQQILLSLYGDDWLTRTLRTHFADQTVKVEQIRDYVLTETPCYKYADVLRGMGDVVPADGRGRVAYATDIDRLVRFEGGLFDF